MRRIKRWARGRQGVSSIVLSLIMTGAAVNAGMVSAVEAPLAAVLVLPVVALVVAVVAVFWDSNVPNAPRFTKSQPPSATRQFREDSNAAIVADRNGYLFAKRWYFIGTGCPPVRLKPEFVSEAMQRKEAEPVLVAFTPHRRYWCFQGRWVWENQGLEPRDVLALLRERDRKQARNLERAHVLLDVEQGLAAPLTRQRAPIPRDVRQAVFSRDGGRCIECRSDFDLQYDHVIPFSMGGADTLQNLQLLCSSCNQRKGATI